jgi:glycosyltransferase involved in cell wall biosynthesis
VVEMRAIRTALCHEWTTVYGGSEQVARRLAQVVDARDVYTFAADPSLAGELFAGRTVHVYRTGLTAVGRRHWPLLLPLMPGAWSRLDLSPYDLVLTSAHAAVNAIRVRPDAALVSYCHTPMRYAWNWRIERRRLPAPLRPAWPAVAAALRRADREWARGVTAFIANSHHVAARIREAYGRDSVVVHPPIETGFWFPRANARRGTFFLLAGRLVPYKRADIAVKAARLARAELVIAGGGPELARLRRIAGPQVRFVVNPSRRLLRALYRRARALVNPGVEDFGMTMGEAQACGTPVIALAAGGAPEIVVEGRTGVLYKESSPEALRVVLRDFDPDAFRGDEARSNAERFAPARFDEGVGRVIEEVVRGGRASERCATPR